MIDVMEGRAVRAVRGDRAHYRPVRSVLHEGSDPLGLARALRDRLGSTELYLADLDAILGKPPALPLLGEFSKLPIRVWVDPGIRVSADVAPILQAGAAVVVLGLETLRGPAVLAEIVETHGPDRIAFSLDLRDGRPLVPTESAWGTADPLQLAEIAIEAGIRRMIVLDLARVGTGAGTGTEPLIAGLRTSHPALEIVAGGGIAGRDDLARLESAGASAALVGSALHDGRLFDGSDPLSDSTRIRRGPSASAGYADHAD